MTTNTELLKKVIDSIINEDDAAATESFKTYATHKFKGILEGDENDSSEGEDGEDDGEKDDDEKDDDKEPKKKKK